ncbi:hypothetical protein QPK87_17785 [Kamptonema cortianum]|nr:hypothetical protein [Geitlerinema splendidum]MDK3158406.1 hypothetical protein [Kamptonema cortianum]
MDTRIVFAVPPNDTHVYGVLKHSSDRRSGIRLSRASAQSNLLCQRRRPINRDLFAGVGFKHLTHQWSHLWIGSNDLAMPRRRIEVANGSHTWEDALSCLFGHPLLHFFTKVVAEVLR